MNYLEKIKETAELNGGAVKISRNKKLISKFGLHKSQTLQGKNLYKVVTCCGDLYVYRCIIKKLFTLCEKTHFSDGGYYRGYFERDNMIFFVDKIKNVIIVYK